MRAVLETARDQKRLLTYLELAERLGLEPPYRIHRITRVLELLADEDLAAGRVPLAALVTSKVRSGLPAPGFFEYLAQRGVDISPDPAAFHRRWVDALFSKR
ncbi:MAG: hypothetical protein Kow0020_12360 [Wenzhouxiangellaceae bacterium]